jgi:hypothetical protein
MGTYPGRHARCRRASGIGASPSGSPASLIDASVTSSMARCRTQDLTDAPAPNDHRADADDVERSQPVEVDRG